MKEAVFQYKCRQCGKVYDGACCGECIAFNVLLGVVMDISFLTNKYIGTRPHMVEHHICNRNGDVGIGDLIGYIIRRTD